MRSQSYVSEESGLEPPLAGSFPSSSDEDSPGGTSGRDSQTDLESLASWDPDSDQGCTLSLAQRVQVNRSLLQQLLKNQGDGERSGPTDPDPDGQQIFVSSRLPRQQQCEFRARMKRRCLPLRADHNLLTPAAQTLSGVRLRPVAQARSEGTAVSGHDSDSSSNESALGATHRRLRFEDETETDVEFRYQERQRQRRRSSQQLPGVLASKPDLNLYLAGRAANDPGRLVGRGVNHCDACGTVLEDLNLRLHPDSDGRGTMNMWTEPIRETYIGSVMFPDTRRGAFGVPRMKVKRMSNELNGNLPINPYFPEPPSQEAPGYVRGLTYSEARNRAPLQDQEIPKRGPVPVHTFSKGEMMERTPGLDPSAPNSTHSETAAGDSPPADSDRQLEELTIAELRDDTSNTSKFKSRDESSRLSLRRLFSNVNISRRRSNSLDLLTSQRRTTSPDRKDKAKPKKSQSFDDEEASAGTSSRSATKSPRLLLKKSPSLQSLNVGSPFLQLRKSLSVQSFGSPHRKKKDRSENYKPATECVLQRCLSVEDVGQPSSVRSVGRVLQVCPDGTFLIELCREPPEKFGFIISRGRGRLDSGVYVEDMVDSSTEKLYAGLLSVGDEIVEVNGEKVACLSLDQVTHLMTQNTTTTVRVLRHWKPPSR